MIYNIAIDGPSGAGKSTVAKHLAKQLSIIHLDTGAMYRGIACYFLHNGVEPTEVDKIVAALPSITMDVYVEQEVQQVVVNDVNFTPYIRQHEVSMAASTISKIPEVRVFLVDMQRKIAAKQSCVLDGRDIGTVVLPDALHKFFITASPEVRADRRYKELIEKGSEITYEEVLKDVIARDKQDTERTIAPLKPAQDSVIIDTSDMDLDSVLAYVYKLVTCTK